MDLRRTLVWRLALALAALLTAFMLVWLADLQSDARAEQAAATRLVDVLLASHNPAATPALAEHLASGPLRHVRAQLLPTGTPPTAQALPGWVQALGLSPVQTQARQWVLGAQTLWIEPDPYSELREKLIASAQVLAMLTLFGAVCLGMTWYAVEHALRPVRDIEAGLARLENGETQPRLPRFALREFQAIADKVTQLASALHRARGQQAQLTQELIEVQDKERRELAAELHDEFGQSLTAINASASYIERHAGSAPPATLAECASDIRQAARSITEHVRQRLAQLRPYGLEAHSMADVLAEMVDSWQARLPELQLACHIDTLPPLPPPSSLALYRCLQEALTNAVRHSQASRIQIACSVHDTQVVLVVTDNGQGRAEQLQQQPGSGLLGLRERVRLAGGQLQIHNPPGGGIALSARLPLTDPEAA